MGKSMHKGHYGHYSGNSKFSKRHDEDYDAKEAYNKNLTASARLHYLENDRHDHESPAKNIVGMAGKALESAKKAATTAKVKKYNQAMKDAGASDDYNISQSDFRNMRNMERGLMSSPGWPSNKQWDGNEWSSPAPGQKRRKLKAGPDTNYNRRDKDSYFYDEDFAADAGPTPTREELEKKRSAAREAVINRQK